MDIGSTTIRPATSADAAQIADVDVRAWRWAYRGLVSDAYLSARSVSVRTEAWLRNLELPRETQVWVAENKEGVVGFVSAGPSRDDDAAPSTGEIHAIYIDPARVGTGLGRRLFDTAMTWLRDRGNRAATAWVLDSNDRARRFYESVGWQLDGGTIGTTTELDERFELHLIRYGVSIR